MNKEAQNKIKAMMYLMKTHHRFVVFDRESTHFIPNINYGKILEISAIKIDYGKDVETFDTLVNPDMKIPKKITELTGISNKMCEGQPNWKKVVADFIAFCEDCPVIGHNVGTDIRYIDYYAQRIGKRFNPMFIDTLSLAKWDKRNDKGFLKKEGSLKLEALAKTYHIKDENHHRAMNDVIVTRNLYFRLRKKLLNDVNAATKADYDRVYRPSEFEFDLVDLSKMEVRSANLWQKKLSGKQYSRLYVKIYYNKQFADIFYDFITKEWGVKSDGLPFILPEGYGNTVMKLISDKYHLKKGDCYKASSYEKH